MSKALDKSKDKLNKKEIVAETNKIKQELQYSKLNEEQKQFIYRFIKRNKKKIAYIVLLIFVEILVGLSLPIISRLYLKNSFELIEYKIFFITVSVLLGLTGIYLLNSFFRIIAGEKITLKLVNDIRKAWFVKFFRGNMAYENNIDGRRLITKFVYHVQLLKLGANVVINDGVQAALLYLGILAYSFVFNDKLFFILFLAAPLLIIIFLITYFIGKYYVAREQTFNTKIIESLTDGVLNFDLYKLQNRENEKYKEMETLIELDTHFRIRRNLWIKFSNRLLYGIILIVGIGLYVLQAFWPVFDMYSVTNMASDAIILGFFTRLLFSVARTGMYFEAFRLGLHIALPDFSYKKSNLKQKSWRWNDLMIKSKKTKISYYSGYIKNLELPLSKGDKILLFSPDPFGKTTLAKVITGQKCIDSIIFKFDKKRVPSAIWCENNADNYFISPETNFNTTVGEIIFGENNLFTSSAQVEDAYALLKNYAFFDFIFDYRDTLGRPANLKRLSNTQKILTHIAHCLINNKNLITIDHICMDSINSQILEGLDLLISKSPETTIVFFSSNKNNKFEYAKTYAIHKNEIKEV